MDWIQSHILTLILFLPLIAAGLILLFPRQQLKAIRWFALTASLLTLALGIYLWILYDPNQPGYQFQEVVRWYTVINANYHVGVDGLSVPMVLLTVILTPAALLISFSIKENVRAYMALFLMLETGMLGVFLSLDLLIFFIFWEIGLIPMYFLINQWGSEKGEREIFGRKMPARQYASFKFLVYTIAGSLGLLLAIQLIGVVTGTFSIIEITAKWSVLQEALTLFGIPIPVSTATVKIIAFWAFVLAFSIKIPVWPFHTWLPDAHTEAPTAGSMILAGVLLKLGAYGFLRLVLPLFPAQAKIFSIVLAVLAVIAIIMGAFASWGQSDFKRLVAYSSVSHMGWVVLGIAAAGVAYGSMTNEAAIIATNGAILQMFNHGLSAAGMFLLVGVIYERTHSRSLNDYGGLFPLMPVYGGILIFTAMASLGLPGLNGFVSEYMVVQGVWPTFSLLTAISMIGLLFTGAYILKAIGKVLHGPMNKEWVGHPLEINWREIVAIAPLMVLMLFTGIWPSWIVEVINATVLRWFG